MVRKWITAAAAAGALASAGVSDDAQEFGPEHGTGREARSSMSARPSLSARHAYAAGGTTERARVLRVAEEVRRIVARYADKDARLIGAPHTFEELGLDGVGRTDVTLGLEARFDLDISDEEADHWRTVGEVVAFVADRLRGQRAS